MEAGGRGGRGREGNVIKRGEEMNIEMRVEREADRERERGK